MSLCSKGALLPYFWAQERNSFATSYEFETEQIYKELRVIYIKSTLLLSRKTGKI